ncbi:NAD(P)H-hydrate dehydratase [Segnochrobactrum spirostomi]|uniref:Bifunctional NAD(P)H-hydrate repair enzyme n=1 Tax=Segnochrobactrum spirostomi TaxID=2608987 RepID=A0A6A7Y007_9HYPH|nr:NAD(P)H-hydrate dehydratase [Segnochrobactrum spirostomi]MQT12065.1 NAD(P)H-hydrate dehydratase [Segnochrobactrum spirostomi]
MHELLTPEEMGRADRLTIESGIPGFALMEAAGYAVADAVANRIPLGRRVLVLAGPGNNGGDGFVAARVLADRGYRVRLMLLGTREVLKGDAAIAAGGWRGAVEPASPDGVRDADVIVDALFGAGLDRPLGGIAASLVDAANASGALIVAVDLPSGISGKTGAILGTAIAAAITITFFRRKPGHLLYPGRAHCGRVRAVEIGISDDVLAAIGPSAFANAPALWRAHWSAPRADGHKYDRGHAVVVSGPAHATGAARLAAGAALRVGAGLVTVAAPPDAVAINAAHLTAVMVRGFEGAAGLDSFLADRRFNSVVIGPGLGADADTRALVATVLAGERGVVLDADALTAHRDDPAALFARIAGRLRATVMTPHAGEFARLFPDLAADPALPKTDRARMAAARSGAVIVLKGADTVVAAPDGRLAINENAPPWLATAGSGDVLSGLIGGLVAQGMPAFEAAAMAVWVHGAAGDAVGPGLIAEDLAPAVRGVIAKLVADTA